MGIEQEKKKAGGWRGGTFIGRLTYTIGLLHTTKTSFEHCTLMQQHSFLA